MRDSLSILDQAIAMGDGSVDYNNLVSMLGLVTNEYLFEIVSAIIERNIEKAMLVIEKIVFSGKDVHLFIKDLTSHFRNLLMIKVTNNPEDVLDMSLENISLIKEQGSRIRVEEIMRDIRILQEAEANAKISKQARLYLELATIKMCKIEYDTSNEVILSRINKIEEALRSGKVKVVASNKQSEDGIKDKGNGASRIQANKEQAISSISKVEENHNAKSTIGDIKRAWKDVLEGIKARREMVVFASLMTGRPVDCENGVVTVQYEEQYSFNKDRLEKPENSRVVNEVISDIMRESLKVRYITESNANVEMRNNNPQNVLVNALGESALEIIDE